MSDFVHLHVHSHYSLLDGLSKIDELIDKAKEEKMKALALTDHGSMYGVIEFYQKAKKAGLKPIIGQEFYLARYGMENKRAKTDIRPYHLILLAKNKIGYKNLIKLTSEGHLRGFYYKPRIDFELLEKYHGGLIALTSCLQGEVPQTLINHDQKKTEEVIKKYLNLFGQENFYLEVQNHPNLEHQNFVNKKLIELGEKLNVQVVSTNDIHYINPEDDEAQDILVCIQTKKKKDDKNRINYLGEDYSFKSVEKMQEAFKEHPEVIKNTLKIAEQCHLEIELGKITLPHFALPEGENEADDYLKKLCQNGLSYRYPSQKKDKEIIERLEYELSVIKKTGFAPYFLIVHDFVNWAKSQGIVVGPGRGSAAGSIVSYLLNITNVDPIKYDLLFERFLNPERISMPDIDLDFADTRRDEVIKYVESKYGKDHVAQIITFGTMAARASVRDVGRVIGLPYAYCDKVAKLIPMFASLDEALRIIPDLHEIYTSDPDGKRLLDLAKKLEGVARHASTHACGVVITKETLEQYVPVQFAAQQDDQIIVSQYSLHPIEDLGLLKMDFLGLKNLTILENTIDIIKKARGREINIDELPLDDKKTFKLLEDGQTTGVFQLESSGMKRYLKQLKPTQLEDIIAMVALYRPGPMEFIPNFIAGKHGLKVTKYLHPKLKPILEKTYGVAVYQEQLMRIARDLAGFTLGEADVLRKAVGKKISKLLKEQREKFISGCVKNKISKATSEKIFDFIEPFARYGFNRAHAACYALIAYQTAYFKANYPDEFLASLLTSDYGDIDRVAIEVEECERMGINVLPPDINESFSTFTAVFNPKTKEPEKKIRFGLLAIKNIGTNIAKTIIKERKENGIYKSLEDFLRRVKTKDLNKKSLESLIKSGALDKFGERHQMLENVNLLLTYAKGAEKEAQNGQKSLFGTFPVEHEPILKLKETEPATKNQRLGWEKELLGMYISEHPLEEYSQYLKNLTIPLSEMANHVHNPNNIKIGGIITHIQRVITRNNESMLFVKLEDTSGRTEVLVFPTVLKSNPTLWQEDKIVLVQGKVSDKDGLFKLLCNQAEEFDLEKIKNQTKTTPKILGIVYISLPATADKKTFDQLKNSLTKNPGPYHVHLKIHSPQKTKIIATKFCIGERCFQEIKILVGENNIKLEKK